MDIRFEELNGNEKTVFALRSLYSRYGYTQYKMSKFEEYDLYVRNKAFLLSDNIITFTDTNGRLMALKPDVTLSIIKNTRDTADGVQKLYYNENVYRVAKGSRTFKEILQTGLECIGDVDDYCLSEVLMLAAESLRCISEDFVLDISHLGILSAFVDKIASEGELRQSIMKCIGEKNLHEMTAVCAANDISPAQTAVLRRLITCSGAPDAVLAELKEFAGAEAAEALEQLTAIISAFDGSPLKDKLRLDLSVVSDMKYYNGIVFKGFINSVPGSVLSGGQYDTLMQKMGRRAGAVGFAIYLDMLERLQETEKEFDVDIMLLYDKDADIAALRKLTNELTAAGKTVFAAGSVQKKLKYRQLWEFKNGEVREVANA